MYSLSGRLNIIGYNMMIGMVAMGALNFLHCYLGEHNIENTSFEMTQMKTFLYDKYYDEEVAAFQFDMKADIRGLINWNTNIIFASIVCQYETSKSKVNYVTVWDQRIKREATDDHQIDLKDEWVEYYLTDVMQSLKDKKIEVFLRWEQMTTIGPYYSGM